MPTKDPAKRRLANQRYYDRHRGERRRRENNQGDSGAVDLDRIPWE